MGLFPANYIIPHCFVLEFYCIVSFHAFDVIFYKCGGIDQQTQVIIQRGINAIDDNLAAVYLRYTSNFRIYRIPICIIHIRSCQQIISVGSVDFEFFICVCNKPFCYDNFVFYFYPLKCRVVGVIYIDITNSARLGIWRIMIFKRAEDFVFIARHLRHHTPICGIYGQCRQTRSAEA